MDRRRSVPNGALRVIDKGDFADLSRNITPHTEDSNLPVLF